MFEASPGEWQWGELQVNLMAMVRIKSRPGSGHDVYKFARSIAAYDPSMFTYKGGCDDSLCDRVKAGMIMDVDLADDTMLANDPALLAKLCKAIMSGTCRLACLTLRRNQLGPEDAEALAEALKVNSSITSLSLDHNKLGRQGGKAIAEALKVNTSITTINLCNLSGTMSLNGEDLPHGADCCVGEDAAIEVAEALKINTSITDIQLDHNLLGAKGSKVLAEALTVNKTITSLNVNWNGMGEGGTAVAKALKVNKFLQELNIIGNGFGPATEKAIVRAWRSYPRRQNVNSDYLSS